MKKFLVVLLILSQVILSGCWDQRLLKRSRLVYSSAFDLTEDKEKIRGTAVIRDFKEGVPTNLEVSGTGHTIRDVRIHLDKKVSDNFEPSKNRVFLLGESLAKEDIYDFLDIFYRDPNSSISSKIAITRGDAGPYLMHLIENNVLISEYIIESISSAESVTEVPKANLQTICTIMFDEGRDFMLPMFEYKNDEIVLNGTALFDERRMTGELDYSQSALMLIMMKQKSKVARFVTKVNSGKEPNIQNYITFNIVKPKVKVEFSSLEPGNIHVNLSLKSNINVVEYPPNRLFDQKELDRLNDVISKNMTKRLEETIEKVQDANSDVLGLGRELIAFHPEVWKELNWKEEYQRITFHPKVELHIVGTGIIN
ncbi:Ger(x)C family spore germination protein [Rossellomorea sp. FS2]|uniref:Ger(x)C family spore germination protein n=1 Tax=Rossellomorea TaxID=2837508 RepID=UPI003A4D9AEE